MWFGTRASVLGFIPCLIDPYLSNKPVNGADSEFVERWLTFLALAPSSSGTPIYLQRGIPTRTFGKTDRTQMADILNKKPTGN